MTRDGRQPRAPAAALQTGGEEPAAGFVRKRSFRRVAPIAPDGCFPNEAAASRGRDRAARSTRKQAAGAFTLVASSVTCGKRSAALAIVAEQQSRRGRLKRRSSSSGPDLRSLHCRFAWREQEPLWSESAHQRSCKSSHAPVTSGAGANDRFGRPASRPLGKPITLRGCARVGCSKAASSQRGVKAPL